MAALALQDGGGEIHDEDGNESLRHSGQGGGGAVMAGLDQPVALGRSGRLGAAAAGGAMEVAGHVDLQHHTPCNFKLKWEIQA